MFEKLLKMLLTKGENEGNIMLKYINKIFQILKKLNAKFAELSRKMFSEFFINWLNLSKLIIN